MRKNIINTTKKIVFVKSEKLYNKFQIVVALITSIIEMCYRIMSQVTNMNWEKGAFWIQKRVAGFAFHRRDQSGS